MTDDYITLTIGKQKSIALIAHDGKKHDLINWCQENKDILSMHFLCGTGTTARMITDQTGLPVKGYNSGPLGGDQQIGAKIVEGKIDFIVFFSDPLTAQPHIDSFAKYFSFNQLAIQQFLYHTSGGQAVQHSLQTGTSVLETQLLQLAAIHKLDTLAHFAFLKTVAVGNIEMFL